MEEKKANICFLVLCGLPASGKTSLAEQLVSQSVTSETRCNVMKFTYDTLMPHLLEMKLIESTSTLKEGRMEVSPWKKYRGEIVRCIGILMEYLTDTYTAAKTSGEIQLQLDLEYSPVDLQTRFIDVLKSSSPVDRDIPSLVIIDDNMYYRSMRYDYYQLARKYRAGFCQVYMDCDIEVAVEVNKQRPQCVPNDVIITMATRFEKPDPQLNAWENNSLTIRSRETFQLSPVFSLIKHALQEPVQPVPEVDVEAQNQSRQICSDNIIHQCDQVLRKLVSKKMALLKGKGLSKSELKMLAGSIQDVRSKMMIDLKAGNVQFPDSLEVTNVCQDSGSPLLVFLEKLFEDYTGGTG